MLRHIFKAPGTICWILLGLSTQALNEWQKLLHFASPASPSSSFYISKSGAKDPENELKEFLVELQNPTRSFGQFNLPAACVFPARAQWVRKNIPAAIILPSRCPDFEQWRDGLNAESVSIVFSSYYPNNPASMFGHSFLRIHRKADRGRPHSALLDYGANFSAQATGPKWLGLLYVIKGLLGGYEGYYDIDPYYRKVSEYHAQEDRDLWEYELNLSADEVAFTIAHLWELWNASHFQYYFLDQNCSYQPLALLDAVRPDWNLTAQTGLFVYPASTLKILAAAPARIRMIRQIPSLRKKIDQEWSLLPSDQKLKFKHQEYVDTSLLGFSSRYFQYKKLGRGNHLSTEDEVTFRKVLQRISENPPLEPQDSLYQNSISEPPPHQAHIPGQIGIGALGTPHHSAATLQFRAGFHDYLNPWAAMLPGSKIRYLDGSILIRKHSIRLKEWTWVDLQSFQPVTFLQSDLSWKFNLETRSVVDDPHCLECFSPLGVDLGPGLSIANARRTRFLGAFLTLHSALAPRFSNHVRAGNSALISSAFEISPQLRATADARLAVDWIARNQDRVRPFANLGFGYDLSKKLELRFTFEKSRAPIRASIEIRYPL